MGEWKVKAVSGVAFVLPKFESVGVARRVGPLAVFGNVAWDRFGIGLQILEAGAIVQIGPAYVGICHIDRQVSAFDRISHLPSPPTQSGQE